MNIFIALYLVGSLMTFGMVIGVFEKFDFGVFMVALIFSLLSWGMVGYALTDLLLPDDKKIKEK